MTSGPAPTDALPPDPQPDPQVVAWMRGYLRANPHRAEAIGTSKARATKAWLTAHGHESLSGSPRSLRELIDAYDAALNHPLTPTDIPAGQGTASLYRDTDGAVWFKEANGYQRIVLLSPDEMSRETPSGHALEAFLAATLPTVTEESA